MVARHEALSKSNRNTQPYKWYIFQIHVECFKPASVTKATGCYYSFYPGLRCLKLVGGRRFIPREWSDRRNKIRSFQLVDALIEKS